MKIKVDFITGAILLFISIVILLLPIFNVTNILLVLRIFLLTYAITNLGRFLFNQKTKDYEGLYTAIISILLFAILFFIKINDSSLVLSLLIFSFVIAESFIRLKKADYYHDRKEKIWLLEITTLIVFVISGLLTSLHLLLTKDSHIFMIGFLFFINGFIETIDPIVNYIKYKEEK